MGPRENMKYRGVMRKIDEDTFSFTMDELATLLPAERPTTADEDVFPYGA